jgi:hypothetical protein
MGRFQIRGGDLNQKITPIHSLCLPMATSDVNLLRRRIEKMKATNEELVLHGTRVAARIDMLDKELSRTNASVNALRNKYLWAQSLEENDPVCCESNLLHRIADTERDTKKRVERVGKAGGSREVLYERCRRCKCEEHSRVGVGVISPGSKRPHYWREAAHELHLKYYCDTACECV